MADPITFGDPVDEPGVAVGLFPALVAGVWFQGIPAARPVADLAGTTSAVVRTLLEEGGIGRVGKAGSGLEAYIQLQGVWDVVLIDSFDRPVLFVLTGSGAGPLPIPPARYERNNEAALRTQIERMIRENAANIRALGDVVLTGGTTLVADPRRVVAAPLPPPTERYDRNNEAAMRAQVERVLREQAEAIRAIAEELMA